MKTQDNLPAKTWPLKSSVRMVDAWGQNPVDGKVIAHYPVETNILVEDTRGIRHFGQTWRVVSAPPAPVSLFDDLLGDEPTAPSTYDFEDLLG